MSTLSKVVSFLSRRFTTVALALGLAVLAASPAMAQTPPVHSRSLMLIANAWDPTGRLAYTMSGTVLVESQRVADPIAGDVWVVSLVFTNFPMRNVFTGATYTVNLRETVMKPFAATVPVEITMPMVWQAGGTDTRTLTAIANWDIFSNADGSVMSWWPIAPKVTN